MTFYIANPEIDRIIKEILKKIRLSMNGIVSEQMTNRGIIYKKNYGVSVPRLREISTLYPKNHDVAQRLWSLEIRETMILATLLEPHDKLTYKEALLWINSFHQMELVEQTIMNLFSKLAFSNQLALDSIASNKNWYQVTGFILASRIVESFKKNEITRIVDVGVQLSNNEDIKLYKSIALCFSRFCRINKETALFILKMIESFSSSENYSQQYISKEVRQEIIFLDIL